MPPFLICLHDASPAFAVETRTMIRDLAPLVGRHVSIGVVPDWHGAWPVASHPEFCSLLTEASEELLLHGYSHERRRGRGAATLLADGCDEMNGFDIEETERAIERGQRVFGDVFGKPARGFLAPGWQRGHVRSDTVKHLGLEYTLGFFALESFAGHTVPLATWSWDCGRWRWLGHIGQGIGSLLHTLDARVPSLALHPRDLERGFWPNVLRLIEELLERGYEPTSVAGVLEARC